MTNMLVKIQDLRRKPYMDRERNSESVRREDFLMKQLEELKEKTRQQQQYLDMKDARIQELTHTIEEQEKITDELKEALSMHNSIAEVGGNLSTMKVEIDESMSAMKEEVLSKQETAKEELIDKMCTAKNELSEKVHTENVKCYRNIQVLMEDLNKKLETIEVGKRSMKKVRRGLRTAIIIGILNFLLLAGMIVYQFDLLKYLTFLK